MILYRHSHKLKINLSHTLRLPTLAIKLDFAAIAVGDFVNREKGLVKKEQGKERVFISPKKIDFCRSFFAKVALGFSFKPRFDFYLSLRREFAA